MKIQAAAAGGVTGFAVLIVWLAGHFHLALSAEDGAIIAGLLASAAALVKKDGLRGIWRRIVNGNQDS